MEDDSTILKLYENFADEIYKMTVEKIDISKKIAEQENMLINTFSDEQKKIFCKLNQFENEKNEFVNKNAFIYAYKLATKLIIESLSENKKED